MSSLPHGARRTADEDGYGLAVVLILAFVMSILAATAFVAMRNTELNTREDRNVTSARGVADGGAEELIYELGLSGGKWDETKTAPKAYAGALGDGSWDATVTPNGADRRIVNVVGEWPAGSGDTVEVEVVIERDTVPAAFGFAMFADSGITIHHHSGSTWLAPRVFTVGGVHTNGDAAIDGSAEFDLTDPAGGDPGTFTAVGRITMPNKQASVGSHPRLSFAGGTVPAGGYSWRYNIGNGDLCYPGAVAPVGTTTGDSNGCPKTSRFVAGVRIAGFVRAGSLVMDTNGKIEAPSPTDPAKGYGLEVSPSGTYNVTKGTITGTVGRVGPPKPISFPSLDYERTYKLRAQGQGPTPPAGTSCPTPSNPALMSCGKQHVWNKGEDWFKMITNPANGMYRKADHTLWNTTTGGTPAYIVAPGDWYIYGGINFTLDAVRSAMTTNGVTVPASGPLPIVVAGSLITPNGSITAQGRLYMVGRGNRTDFLQFPNDPTKPHVTVDMTRFRSNTVVTGFSMAEPEPAVLAAGGSIDGKDSDDDSSWLTGADLEKAKSNATWIRGLVYSGEWDEGSKSSEAEDQHWHNYDPKNEARIYGAQVGGKLHDCNNFEFTYDPIIQNAFGFTSGDGTGAVEIVSWDER